MKLRNMEYTTLDLELNRQRYKDNYALLLASVGTPDHKEYSKREKQLDKEQIKIMKALGVYVENPCPVMNAKYCYTCTGYFKLTEVKGKPLNIEVSENDVKAHLCSIKNIK